MKSQLTPVCQSLHANKTNPEVVKTIISQFISTFDINEESITNFTKDPMLPDFIQFLNAILCSTPITKPSNGPVPEIVGMILTFLNSLVVINSALLDNIAATCNLDLLIPQFFRDNLADGEIVEMQTSHIFLPLKFVALVSSSRRIQLTSTPASNVLIDVVSCLLNSPQLAAWSASILAGLCRNCEPFAAIIKVHPLAKVIKQKLVALLPSSDPCVVISSLSASVALFSMGSNAETALTASMKYLTEESYFPLAAQLCCWTILDLSKKVRLSEKDITSLLDLSMTTSGIRACTIYSLLSHFIDMKYRFGTQKQMKAIVSSLIECDDSFTAVAGCQFLYGIAETNPSLLIGLDEDHLLLKKAVFAFDTLTMSGATDKMEALLIEMRLLIEGSQITDEIVELIRDKEEVFFLNFLRNIEANNSFLSVAFFSLMMTCSRFLPKWVLRIKRLLVDSQFPALLVHVLSSSQNRRAITDALRALQFYMNDCEVVPNTKNSFFFDSAVGGFIVINKNKNTEVATAQLELEQERHNTAVIVSDLENEKKQLLRENASLQAALEHERDRTVVQTECTNKSHEELEKRNKEIIELQKKISQLRIRLNDKKEKLSYAQSTVTELKEHNAQLTKLTKKLQGVELENMALTKSNNQMESHITSLQSDIAKLKEAQSELRSLAKALNKELHNKEDQLSAVQKSCYEAQTRNQKLQDSIEKLIENKQILIEENNKIKLELEEETARSVKLSERLTDLEATNIQMEQSIRSVKEIEDEFKAKKSELRTRIREVEKERRKWESIAKFVHQVGESKGTAMNDVFGSVGVDM